MCTPDGVGTRVFATRQRVSELAPLPFLPVLSSRIIFFNTHRFVHTISCTIFKADLYTKLQSDFEADFRTLHSCTTFEAKNVELEGERRRAPDERSGGYLLIISVC